eukprot:scaffold143726_cov74-Cyclotella_meneghiniana.AAC.4
MSHKLQDDSQNQWLVEPLVSSGYQTHCVSKPGQSPSTGEQMIQMMRAKMIMPWLTIDDDDD